MSFAKSEVVVGACDNKYLMDFGISFINSSLAFDNCTHIHIVNPDDKSIDFLSSLNKENKLFTFSSQTTDFSSFTKDQIKAYYSCARFLIAPHLFDVNRNVKLTILDIDSVIKKTLKTPDLPMGLFLRDYNKKTEMKVSASVVYLTYGAISFINRVNSLILESQKNNKMQWYVDQIALYEAYLDVKDKSIVYNFDQDYCSWEWNKDAYIWTGKGDLKFKDKTFLKAKEHYENLSKKNK